MIKTEYARRIDSTGRLVIPSKLRAELGIETGDTYEFSIHEENGRKYLCIECYNAVDDIERAKQILRDAGYNLG